MSTQTMLDPRILEPRTELLTVTPKIQTLDGLWNEAKKLQAGCVDYATDMNRLRISANDGLLNYPMDGGENERLDFTFHSLSQFCGKLELPIQYMRKLYNKGEFGLLAENINFWTARSKESVFIRANGDHVRGFLSQRYSVCDTPTIIDAVYESVDEDKFKVKGYFMTDERFHARLIYPDLLPIAGEDLFYGLQIDSSDVGRATLTVQLMIWKQVCTNGLMVSKFGGNLFRQKHLGISYGEFYSELRTSLARIPSIIENATEIIRDGIETKYSLSSASSFRKAFVTAFQNDLKIEEKKAESIVDLAVNKYNSSRWGVVNALTEVAQEYSLERRMEIEAYASKVLGIA